MPGSGSEYTRPDLKNPKICRISQKNGSSLSGFAAAAGIHFSSAVPKRKRPEYIHI
jgi:hypothetical protein